MAATPYDDPWNLTKALQQVSAKRGPRLSMLAYNRFIEPHKSPWWLSPVSENPAYPWGKIVITNLDLESQMFVGMYVEKGVGASASKGFMTKDKDRRLVMQNDWLWSEFLTALEDGTIEQLVGSAVSDAGNVATIGIDMAPMAPSQDWGQDRGRLPRDFAFFSIRAGEISLERTSETTDLIHSVLKCRSLSAIPTTIAALPDLDWMWIDIQVGCLFGTEDDRLPEWNSERIWDVTCQPWSDWLRMRRSGSG